MSSTMLNRAEREHSCSCGCLINACSFILLTKWIWRSVCVSFLQSGAHTVGPSHKAQHFAAIVTPSIQLLNVINGYCCPEESNVQASKFIQLHKHIKFHLFRNYWTCTYASSCLTFAFLERKKKKKKTTAAYWMTAAIIGGFIRVHSSSEL